MTGNEWDVIKIIVGAVIGYLMARYQQHRIEIKEYNARVDSVVLRITRLSNTTLYPEDSDERWVEFYELLIYCEVYLNLARETFYDWEVFEECTTSDLIGFIKTLKR